MNASANQPFQPFASKAGYTGSIYLNVVDLKEEMLGLHCPDVQLQNGEK
jgi:hypothetical protein